MLVQALDKDAIPKGLSGSKVAELEQIDEQLNSPFGEFCEATLHVLDEGAREHRRRRRDLQHDRGPDPRRLTTQRDTLAIDDQTGAERRRVQRRHDHRRPGDTAGSARQVADRPGERTAPLAGAPTSGEGPGPPRTRGCASRGSEYPGRMVRVRLLAGAVIGAVLLWPAGAEALKAPSASQVRLHRFASCPALVSYARSHLRVTHGYPEPPIVALAAAAVDLAGTARRSSARRAELAPQRPPTAAARPAPALLDHEQPGGRGRRARHRQDRRLHHLRDRAREAPGRLCRRHAEAPRQPRPRRRRRLRRPAASPRQPRDRRLRPDAAVSPLRARSSPALAASIRSSPYFATAARRPRSPRSNVQRSVGDEGHADDDRRRQVRRRPPERLERPDRHLLGAAARSRSPQLAGRASGWVPTWRFNDVRTGRRFARPGRRRAATIRRPVDFSGLGMLSIVTRRTSTRASARRTPTR